MANRDLYSVLGVSRKAVKSMLFRARDEFRRITMHLGLDNVGEGGKRQWAA